MANVAASPDSLLLNGALDKSIPIPAQTPPQDDENDDSEDGDDDDEDEDEDGTAQAEEIARRLRDQLWADISKAQADQTKQMATAPAAAAPPSVNPGAPASSSSASKKQEAAVTTMKSILGFAHRDTLVQSILSSALVPGSRGNVLDVLNWTVSSGTISKDTAKALSHVLVTLARDDTLFGALRHSYAPAVQLDKGKRKRDEADEGSRNDGTSPLKRPYVQYTDIDARIGEAVRLIMQALAANSMSSQTLDPSVIASIQLQLHQVFLFAVTCSAGGGPKMSELQELSGLIQVIGVLSGIPIGSAPDQHHANYPPTNYPSIPHSTRPWPGSIAGSPGSTDIGTAVYPCLVAGCRKTFSRLFSLRAHQRVHATHRPFRCTACPMSFARNHDLKRHAKLHEKKAWQCAGCDKMFSRRDAIKRHKDNSRLRGSKGEACLDAEIREVDLDREADDDVAREVRRTRMWNEAAASQGFGNNTYSEEGALEEGEVSRNIISRAEELILSIHGPLQALVTSALGASHGSPVVHSYVNSASGEATLASIIARAQSQNLPPQATQSETSEYAGQRQSTIGVGVSSSSLDREVAISQHGNLEMQPLETPNAPTLSHYGLSDEQARLLERAIADAASAAQAQAEAEAAMEEDEEEEDVDDLEGD